MEIKRILCKLLIILLFFISFLSCNKKQHLAKPDNLIPKKQFENIIAEAIYIEGLVTLSSSDINKMDLSLLLYSDLFNRYNITNEQLRSSAKYYLSNESDSKDFFSNVTSIIADYNADFLKNSASKDTIILSFN